MDGSAKARSVLVDDSVKECFAPVDATAKESSVLDESAMELFGLGVRKYSQTGGSTQYSW